MNLEELKSTADAIRAEVGKVVHGQRDVVDMLLIALLSRGHVLIEGPPGVAKTLLARSFAGALSLDIGRIQFTPDLMPGDVLGASIFDFRTNEFRLTKGPVFTDVLLGDEINRAPPKTQAALLQAMNERSITIDGEDHDLGESFFVIATQNPIEQQGTYPLPEAQLDRFLFKLIMDFPSEEEELEILKRHSMAGMTSDGRLSQQVAVLDAATMAEARSLVDQIRLDDSILGYILSLVRATRETPDIAFGASTRAADALAGAVAAAAALDGRDYAIPDDVQRLLPPSLRHRIVLSPGAEIDGRGADDVLSNVMAQIEAPR